MPPAVAARGSNDNLTLRDIPASERKTMPKSDFAGPGRSYPIAKPEDVAAAAHLVGKADSPDTVKRNIIRIAKRKGASFVAQLPKAWREGEKTSAAAIQLPGQAITLATDDSGEGPATTWIQVLRVGKFWSPRYKDFSVTKATLARMVENYKTLTPKAPTELPLDYNHGTNRPDTIEQGKAAGWIKDLELRADGKELWAQVSLTAEAADLVRNEEYRFVSATFEFDHVHTDGDNRQKRIGATLMAAALTNTPFVEGMQPVTLARAAAIALDEETAEAEFSYDEQRRRIQEEIRERFGTGNYAPGCAPCCGPWLVDLFDGYTIYRDCDAGDTFRVDYTLGADGAVTFTSEPVEVRVAYEPLPAPVGEQEMATIKVKDAKGNEIELAEETVTALAKAHAPKSAAATEDTAALDELRTTLTQEQAKGVELATRVQTLEQEKKETAAKTLVDALIRAGKVPLKKREQYVTLAISDRKTFTALTDDLPVLYKYGQEEGSSSDGSDQSASQEAIALTREEMKTDSKLSQADALARVFQKQPALYERYKLESAVKV